MTDQERIEAHWADVRAGIYKASPHIYGTDAAPTAQMHRARANMLFSEAARHIRMALALEAAENDRP